MGFSIRLRAFAAPAFLRLLQCVHHRLHAVPCALVTQPIIGVAIGIVVGGLAQFAMQIPGLKGRGMLFGWRFNPGHPGVKRIGLMMVPSLLGLSVTQINITVSTILASYFPAAPPICFMGCG